MKHIITLSVALFLMAGIKNAQAQTKQETIAWIKEKLEQHGGGDSSSYSNVQVSPCSISFTQKVSNSATTYNCNFNPGMAKSWKVDRDYIYADAKIIQYTSSYGEKNSYSVLYIRNGESGIHERMIKALTHLSTFCEQKKEAF